MPAMVGISGDTAAEIAGSVRDLVGVGELAPGALLPPIRTLAGELGVNRNTVALAYRQLVTAGVAESHGRGGTMIALVPDLPREGAAAARAVVDLASGNPDPRLLPDVLAYVDGYEPALYGAAADHPGLVAYIERWGLGGAAVTHGAVDAIERLLAIHLTRGDAVAVEDPCFMAHISTLRLNGFAATPVPVDDEGMSAEGLEAALRQGARAVIVTPRAQNPTGASVSAGAGR